MAADAAVGQKLVEAVLRHALAGDTVAHAYLFAGPRGLGKGAYARLLAQALNCRGAGDGRRMPPCLECTPCRQIAGGSHPDVMWIAPDGAHIKIDQTRLLKREAAFSPRSGDYRVVVFEDAHRLTAEASNSILKLLEDAPERTVFILLTAYPELLLGTVLSRCQRLSFRAVSAGEVSGHLAATLGLEEDEASFWARLARGNPGRAAEMLADDEFSRRRQFALSVVGGLRLAGDRAIAAWAETVAGDGDDGTYLDMLDGMIRDMAVLQAGLGEHLCLNRDVVSELDDASGGLSARALVGALDHIQHAREHLGHNVNRLMSWELLFLKLKWQLGG